MTAPAVGLRELVHELRECIGNEYMDETARRRLTKCADDIAAALPDGWVACSERLPGLRDDAVVAYFSETDCADTVHIEDYFKPITAGLDENGAQKYTYWYLERKVTHWMPLPPSPATPTPGDSDGR